jgi:hypothetical protein
MAFSVPKLKKLKGQTIPSPKRTGPGKPAEIKRTGQQPTVRIAASLARAEATHGLNELQRSLLEVLRAESKILPHVLPKAVGASPGLVAKEMVRLQELGLAKKVSLGGNVYFCLVRKQGE